MTTLAQKTNSPTGSLLLLGWPIVNIIGFGLAGETYINLYYTHDAELQSLILTDPGMFNAAVDTLLLWQPNLQALVDGQGDTAIITQEQVDAVDGFLTQLSAVASPALQGDIAADRAKLPDPDDFVGMTMEEARGIVVGFGVYLPLVVGQP